MKEIYDSLLLINENGEVFRKNVPFWIILKDIETINTKQLVVRIIIKDVNNIFYDIGSVEYIRHIDCEIVSDVEVMYSKGKFFVYLCLDYNLIEEYKYIVLYERLN